MNMHVKGHKSIQRCWFDWGFIFIGILVAWASGWGVILLRAAADQKASPGSETHSESPRDTIFGLNQLHQFHLAVSAKEWQTIQKAGPRDSGGFWGQLRRFTESATKPATNVEVHRSGAMEFPWVRADFTAEGHPYTNVGIRYKGNFTFMISRHLLKRSLKVEFDHYDPATPRFHGLQEFNLHTGVTDPNKIREALCYAVFRTAGVPAPRTAFAELTLAVPEKYDREYVGLFTLTEQVGSPFLQDRFGSDQGLLMKPLLRGPDFLGESWTPYAERYQPQREATAEEKRRIIEFAKLVNQAEDESFGREIHAYLNVEAFLRFLAVSAFLVHLDSPLAMPQNYYLYLHPQSRKFFFIPWDLDLGMAAWPFGGPPEDQMNLSLTHPHIGKHTLIDRLLGVPEVKAQYLKLCRELAAVCFTREQLLAQITTIEETVREPLAKEARAVAARKESGSGFGFGPPGGMIHAPEPRIFVKKRIASIQDQLEGRSDGYVPQGGFGPFVVQR